MSAGSAPGHPEPPPGLDAPEGLVDEAPPVPAAGPRAVRVTLAPGSAVADLPPAVVEPPSAGGDANDAGALIRTDRERALLIRAGAAGKGVPVLLLPPAAAPGGHDGVVRREVVVDGWRVEVDVELAARAALRERAVRGRDAVGHSGPTEVRAIIPGVVLSVSVSAGDVVTTGRQLLLIEAMKMQNELRAPRDGTIERVSVGAGQTIEVGDLLVVID